MENSRLKVGNYYRCIKDVVMKPSGSVAYIKDKFYKCENPDALTDELGDTNHYWYDVEEFDKYFIISINHCADNLSNNNPLNDNVNHPIHYNAGNIECIDAMLSAYGKEVVSNFCLGNIFKYIWRFKSKNGIEDLNKAKWYLDKIIELNQ